MEIFEKSLGIYVDDKLSLSQLLLKTMSWKTGLRYPRNIHPPPVTAQTIDNGIPSVRAAFPSSLPSLLITFLFIVRNRSAGARV